MAIIYDWYKNPCPDRECEEAVALHPRPIHNGKRDMEALCRRIHEDSALSMGNVRSVLDSLVRLCAEEFRDGKEVHIKGLGSFVPTLTTSEPVTTATKYKHTKVQLKSISFRPDARLKRELANVHFKQNRHSTPQAALSEIEIDSALWDYFAEHDTLTRRAFEHLCHLSRTTANRHLKRLREEGKLHNLGEERHPVYVPAAGQYGRSRDNYSVTLQPHRSAE